MNKKTSIFKQLIFNVVTPVVAALILLAYLNYLNTKRLILNARTEQNLIISDEIKKIVQFQDLALDILEKRLDERMKTFSFQLVNDYFIETDNIESIDLNKVRQDIGMNPSMEDIYVINSNGVVVNTTFKQDLQLHFFSFGESHKNFLLNILHGHEFVSDRFAIENNTKRLKKYSYQPTRDGNYIVEIGIYSKRADEIIGFIKNHLNNISNVNESIISVELFIGEDFPFSLNKHAIPKEEHIPYIKEVIQTKTTKIINEDELDNKLQFQYIYMDRTNTELYQGAVIRIITNLKSQSRFLHGELFKLVLLFLITIIIVIFLIYKRSQVITNPVQKLVGFVNKITDGSYNERAEITGNNEITSLAEHFNIMLEKLEVRNAEIQSQSKKLIALNKNLNNANEVLDRNKKLIEKKNSDLMDSINYALRIQKSLLPPPGSLNDLFADSFIYYRPRNVVSGDFYWFKKVGNNIILSVADCTGHGVPGAFMSMIGMTLLHHIVELEKILDPAKILHRLNVELSGMLHSTETEAAFYDGMDIAVCNIDLKSNKLHFSGAQRPVFIIRDTDTKNLKGDLHPIGEYNTSVKKSFSTQEIELKENDLVYLFSDGYSSQFGDINNKKFMVRRLQKLLIDNRTKNMEEQQEVLINTFEKWKGNKEQVDDILVLGVKYQNKK